MNPVNLSLQVLPVVKEEKIHYVVDKVIEMIDCAEIARKNIANVPIWKQK